MSLGESFRFIELANDINDHMPQYVVRRVTAALNDDRKAVNGARIVVLGVSYKANVGDIRESPALQIVNQLLGLGAELTVVDPHVRDGALDGVPVVTQVSADQLGDADLVLLVTDHEAFDYGAIAASAPLVLDTRNRLADPALPKPLGRVIPL